MLYRALQAKVRELFDTDSKAWQILAGQVQKHLPLTCFQVQKHSAHWPVWQDTNDGNTLPQSVSYEISDGQIYLVPQCSPTRMPDNSRVEVMENEKVMKEPAVIEAPPMTEEVDEAPMTEEVEEPPMTEEVEELPMTEEVEEPPMTEEVEEPPMTETVEGQPMIEKVPVPAAVMHLNDDDDSVEFAGDVVPTPIAMPKMPKTRKRERGFHKVPLTTRGDEPTAPQVANTETTKSKNPLRGVQPKSSRKTTAKAKVAAKPKNSRTKKEKKTEKKATKEPKKAMKNPKKAKENAALADHKTEVRKKLHCVSLLKSLLYSWVISLICKNRESKNRESKNRESHFTNCAPWSFWFKPRTHIMCTNSGLLRRVAEGQEYGRWSC